MRVECMRTDKEAWELRRLTLLVVHGLDNTPHENGLRKEIVRYDLFAVWRSASENPSGYSYKRDSVRLYGLDLREIVAELQPGMSPAAKLVRGPKRWSVPDALGVLFYRRLTREQALFRSIWNCRPGSSLTA